MDESNMDKSKMKKSSEPRKPTAAQIDANRRNAQKSTGPRTPEGRAASSRNRLVHGLRANKHIVLDEDPEEFLILLKDLHDRFRPVGDGEEELVLRIASGQWRLHRTLPMEAGIYRERLQAVAAKDYARKRELTNHKRALSENLTGRPLLRNFLHPLNREEPTLVTTIRLGRG